MIVVLTMHLLLFALNQSMEYQSQLPPLFTYIYTDNVTTRYLRRGFHRSIKRGLTEIYLPTGYTYIYVQADVQIHVCAFGTRYGGCCVYAAREALR